MKPRSRKADAQAIAHHYDVSNEFYALFLDPLMVYTCAYYRDPDGKLEQAQQDKLDLVCRKLELRPGETLLDIGCGWGSLAIWAAQHYGVRAHGVTLSRAQADYAAERIRREGLEGRCRVEHLDYRDLPAEPPYDKIAAVGVIEHVGIPNYPAFFGGVRARLKDGGLYLNHGIVHEFHWKPTSQTEFLYRHVFPNGDLAGLSETLTEMERAGLEILDVEGLRLHYARTCRQWVERLRARADEARGPGRRAHLPDVAPVPDVLGRRLRGRLHRPLPGPHAQARRPRRRATPLAPASISTTERPDDGEVRKGPDVTRQILIISIASFILAQLATFATSIYLHRALAHRSLALRPLAAVLFRAVLWLLTGQSRQQWVAVHRKHHTFADREGDPHSPLLLGFWRVQLWNVYYYVREARNPDTVQRFAPDLAPDWWERHVFSWGWTGLGLGTALLGVALGWWQGVLAMLGHGILYMFVLAPLINGLGHWWGAQNFGNTAYNSRVLAWLTGGESLHNNHHAFPRSPKFSLRRSELDPSWVAIRVLAALKLAVVVGAPLGARPMR